MSNAALELVRLRAEIGVTSAHKKSTHRMIYRYPGFGLSSILSTFITPLATWAS